MISCQKQPTIAEQQFDIAGWRCHPGFGRRFNRPAAAVTMITHSKTETSRLKFSCKRSRQMCATAGKSGFS